MKRYYVDYLKYGIIATLLPILLIMNGVQSLLNSHEADGFLGKYLYIMWFIYAFLTLINAYRIYTKKLYFEINGSGMVINSMWNRIVFNYEDAEFFTAKQSGKARVIHYENISTGKVVKIGMSIFKVDYDELLSLLRKYSGKDVYIKDYGEEPELVKDYLDE